MTTTEIDPTEPRHGGNASSAAAYESSKAQHASDRERIYALIESSPAGLTSKEIGRLLQKEIHTFSGRLTQLKQTWRIVGTGVTREGAEVLVKASTTPPVQLGFGESLRPSDRSW